MQIRWHEELSAIFIHLPDFYSSYLWTCCSLIQPGQASSKHQAAVDWHICDFTVLVFCSLQVDQQSVVQVGSTCCSGSTLRLMLILYDFGLAIKLDLFWPGFYSKDVHMLVGFAGIWTKTVDVVAKCWTPAINRTRGTTRGSCIYIGENPLKNHQHGEAAEIWRRSYMDLLQCTSVLYMHCLFMNEIHLLIYPIYRTMM